MNRLIFAGLCAATTVAVGAAVAAQQLPDAPAKGFGTSITGAYEGWYDNPDGTHTFLDRLLQPQYQAGDGHSGWSEQPH